MVLGLDPGSEGAAVLLADSVPARPVLVAHWKVDGDRAIVDLSVGPDWRLTRTTCPAWAVGSVIWRFAAEAGLVVQAVVVEDAYVGVDPRSAIHVARSGGTVSASFATAAYLSGHEPVIRVVGADPWRSKIGVHARRGEDKKASALRIVPLLVPGISEPGRVVGLSSHVVDACGVALCGLRLRAWEGSNAEWQARAGGGTSAARTSARRAKAAAREAADTARRSAVRPARTEEGG